jgi:hypothetical protein
VRITRLPAAAENVCHSSAAHRDLEENKKQMRSAACDTKPRTAAMMNKMTAEHDSLQAQEYDAAARPLRTGQHAAEGGEQEQKKRQNDQPGAAASAAAHQGGQPGMQNDQPGAAAAAAHQGGQPCMEKGAFAQQQRSQQPEQGTTTVSTVGLAVQHRRQHDSCSTESSMIAAAQHETLQPGTGDHSQRESDAAVVVVSAESTGDEKAEAAAQLARDDELRQQSNCRTEAAEQLLDEDDRAWPDSDDEDDARDIATLEALHRMDFSAMDEDRRQHDSCSKAQAQVQEKTQAHAQVQEKTQAQAQAQAQAEQGTAVAGDSSGDEEQTDKLQKLQQIVEELQKQIVQQQKAERQTRATLTANEKQGKAAADDTSADEAALAAADEAATDEAAVDEVAQMAAAKNGAYEAATEAKGFARLYDG